MASDKDKQKKEDELAALKSIKQGIERLYDALQQPKRLWTFPKAGHNSWPSGPHESWWGEMMDFLGSTDAGNKSK